MTDTTSHRRPWRALAAVVPAVALLFASDAAPLASQSAGAAQRPAPVSSALLSQHAGSGAGGAEITFAKDIAPIFQKNCQVCHSPGSIAPMSLMTYEEVRPWARAIKLRVETRKMPPWHIDKSIGIQGFKNDISMSDEEIATVVRWVDAGMPKGDPRDMPPPVKFPAGDEYRLAAEFGPPDLVVKSTPYTVPSKGQDAWWRPEVPTGVTEPRWLRAIEIKPAYPLGRKVTHHALATLIQKEEGITGLASSAASSVMNAGLLTEWAIGKVGEIYPEGTGKLLLPGSKIRWEVHYSTMAGEEVPNDQVELAMWFYPAGYTPKYRTILRIFNVAPASELEIPPHTLTTHQKTFVMPAPARLESFQPHMHMRGKGMSMEAIYPDGKREVLNLVRDFQWKWHNNYIYREDTAPLLPKGTVLLFTAWHDNTAANGDNPDPAQYITWGDRTVDEMAHAWVGVTYLEQEDFDRMVAERKRTKTTDGGRQPG